MIELRALDFAVLEEIEFDNQNSFRPSVASLSGDLEIRTGLLDVSLGDLQRKGLITGSGSAETKRYQITPKGQERILAGPSIIPEDPMRKGIFGEMTRAHVARLDRLR